MMLIFLSLFSWGDVSLLMKAKSAQQIENIHQQGVQERILKERCDIEIHQNWIPVSCFEWIGKKPRSLQARTEMLGYLNKKCVSALKNRAPLPQKRAFKHILPGTCLLGVQKYYLDRQYQEMAKNSLPEMMKSLDIGKEIVKESGHAVRKANKDQRLQLSRALR